MRGTIKEQNRGGGAEEYSHPYFVCPLCCLAAQLCDLCPLWIIIHLATTNRSFLTDLESGVGSVLNCKMETDELPVDQVLYQLLGTPKSLGPEQDDAFSSLG